jgi:hypothetical protein
LYTLVGGRSSDTKHCRFVWLDLNSIYGKLGFNTRAEATRYAIDRRRA